MSRTLKLLLKDESGQMHSRLVSIYLEDTTTSTCVEVQNAYGANYYRSY